MTETSLDDGVQIYHLLALLERYATGLVTTPANEAEVTLLVALHEHLEKQVRKRGAFSAANEAFRMRRLQLAGNRWATQVLTDLRNVMKLNRRHSLFKAGRLAESLQEHRALLAAIIQRRSAEAARLMKAHFDNGLRAPA